MKTKFDIMQESLFENENMIEPYPKGENKKYKLGTFIEPIIIDTNDAL